jgi:Alpha amylase, catalytic domain/Secretion system C-terminal sorting domain/Carbohydrate-binding module 48 (Isoamylase N-terminal domain)
MKKLTTLLLLLISAAALKAQLLAWTPLFAKDNDNITITVDAAKGNQGLLGHTGNVYIHCGVITNLSTGATDWKYSKFTWGSTEAAALATPAGTNKWTYTINNIRSFFNVPAGETIRKIALLFRSGGCNTDCKVQRNADGSDMYITVYDNSLAVQFTQPPYQPLYTPAPELIVKNIGDNITVTGNSNNPATLRILFNGAVVQTSPANSTSVSATQNITTFGTQKFVLEATAGVTTVKDSFSFDVSPVQPLPPNTKEGINYLPGDTAVYLVLYAPNKTRAHVIGEFNGWVKNDNALMFKTPDGIYYWKRIGGLTPGTQYAYQYVVDDNIIIADPYTELILDKDNDGGISAVTYPNLKPYPTNFTTGLVSVLQTAAPAYVWQVNNFARPDKRSLVMYELLLRDFLEAHDFKTLKDTLNYLKNLGVNAIHIMPFSEFEGNNSWGYNPSYYFAADKYYGPKNRVKEFIDEAHRNGIAVIMDMVLNHACGQSAYAKLYWDAGNNRPAANSAWMNPVATHPFNVCYDFNHQAPATKYLVDRVVEHWLTEYKLDGFRWDLSKGFVQNTGGNWDAYNAERITTWKRIYDKMQQVSNGSYCVLEHLGGNDEEKELAAYGMMLWGKATDNYNQATMGHPVGPNADWNFQWSIHTARGFSQPHLLSYMESHDEERLMYKNITFGNSNASYNVTNLFTALRRNEEAAAFFLTVPGPKLWWQFGELGYEYSINYCPNGTINPNCRTEPKPIKWDYFTNVYRRRLYDIYASLNNLRKLKPNAFVTNAIGYNLGGAFKWLQVTDPSLNITVIGNFDIVPVTGSVTFQAAGTWYDYLHGGTVTATGGVQSFTLQPGEYHVYINQNINGAVLTSVGNSPDPVKNMRVLVYPNPVQSNALVEYDLPESGNVSISILNSQGQLAGTLFRGYQLKGTWQKALNTAQFSTGKLAAGLYLLQIEVNGKRRLEKLLIQ